MLQRVLATFLLLDYLRRPCRLTPRFWRLPGHFSRLLFIEELLTASSLCLPALLLQISAGLLLFFDGDRGLQSAHLVLFTFFGCGVCLFQNALIRVNLSLQILTNVVHTTLEMHLGDNTCLAGGRNGRSKHIEALNGFPF